MLFVLLWLCPFSLMFGRAPLGSGAIFAPEPFLATLTIFFGLMIAVALMLRFKFWLSTVPLKPKTLWG